MACPLFSLGQLVATPGALALVAGAGASPAELLARHQAGDWGKCRSRTPAKMSSRSYGASVSSASRGSSLCSSLRMKLKRYRRTGTIYYSPIL
jgi:hypothetical protein